MAWKAWWLLKPSGKSSGQAMFMSDILPAAAAIIIIIIVIAKHVEGGGS